MNEAVMNFLKKPYHAGESRDFALKVLDFAIEVLEEFKRETGNLYNLEASPAEGASFRLAKADKRDYPEILSSGTQDAPYYTNSVHLPVNATDDIFELLDHQDPLQAKFTGGTVIHIFLGEKVENPDVIANIVKTVASRYRLPYFSITPTFSICPVHGYLPGEQWECPLPHTEEDLNKYGKYMNVSGQ